MSEQVPLPDNGRTGYRTVTCPGCGRDYSWPSGLNPNGNLVCTNETERGTKCGFKMKVMDWEYTFWKEAKRNAQVSG